MMDEAGLPPHNGAAALSTAVRGPHLASHFDSVETISRATSPGVPYPTNEDDKKRYRPRTFSYFKLLPFPVEDESHRDAALADIIEQLYIAVKAQDFSPGALHWTRELQAWLNLKFAMTRQQRATLAKLYYHLCLAPGLDSNTADRFLKMFLSLTRRYHYLKPNEDLTLDWRPLWKDMKTIAFPSEVSSHQSALRKKSHKNLWKLCIQAQTYFDPADRRVMLDEVLPFFSTQETFNAFLVVGIVNALLPTTPAPPETKHSHPEDLFPTLFHLWSLIPRSKVFDVVFIDMFSRFARDSLSCTHLEFTRYGIFTQEQSDLIFTAILRLTEIPVGQANSPYTSVDYAAQGAYFEKDSKKHPVSYMIARWIVYSLSPQCLDGEKSTIASLEGLMDSIETFFHPSNRGSWTTFLGQLTCYLVDSFVSRYNREQSGELETPDERKVNDALKKRFVTCLRDVTFMGLFSKSSRVATYYMTALQGLAYLEPGLILPGALQRFYPSLQGLVEVHRTTSSLNGLSHIANVMAKQKGFRCHITALLALALPGIDANDLGKTHFTLNFIQSVAYSIPMVSLAKEDGAIHDTSIAVQWVQGEMERMEQEGQDVKMDYDNELSDEDEANILRSSTAGFGEFILALMGKIFTLLENLPDASSIRSNTPEESIINAIPTAMAPVFASLSPDLFDQVLEKVATFVNTHVVHQARDSVAWIVDTLCKCNPEKCLKVFIPMLIVNIRNEIDYNHAASDRSGGTDYLPRDRALVWHLAMLGMAVCHVGSELLNYKDELFGIAEYMQEKCKGLPTIHISNYIHHLLMALTQTYPIDNALYEPHVIEAGLDVQHWGAVTAPADLTIRWHRPSKAEIDFAAQLAQAQMSGAMEKLELLMSDNPPVSRKGKHKEWSDEVSRLLMQVKLVVSGVAVLFDPKMASGGTSESNGAEAEDHEMADDEEDALAEVADDDEMRELHRYEAGYPLEETDAAYQQIHALRDDLGRMLSKVHKFLTEHQEDDVACFTALCTAYRAWITDVGFERSARNLQRQLSLYKSDISAFKISGLRKVYPRPLLIKRADTYNQQRVKHNASARRMSALDKMLLRDLAESCLSSYADVRRAAQSYQDSSCRSLIGARLLVVPLIIKRFKEAVEAVDHDRIKGGLYTLYFTGLIRTLSKDWRYAPDALRLYVDAAAIDKPSIQALSLTASYSLHDFGKQFERIVLLDDELIDQIKPKKDVSATIASRNSFIVHRRRTVEQKKAELGLEFTRRAKESHWKIASRCLYFAVNLCIRFDTVAPPEFIELVSRGTNDTHPALRMNYQQAFVSIFNEVDKRAGYSHEYLNFLTEKEVSVNKIQVPVQRGDAEWTDRFLRAFEKPDDAEYMVDNDYPGWLVWGRTFRAMKAKPVRFNSFDEVEMAVRTQMGSILTKEWFAMAFGYLKQEPRDANEDRWRYKSVLMLMNAFELLHDDVTAAKFEDIQALVVEVYGDGTDKHQHRATSEILGALLIGSSDEPPEVRNKVWGFAAAMMLKIFAEDLTPENLQYWSTCLHICIDTRDPRRVHELVDAASAFRLDMGSNAAFKESAKVQLLEIVVNDCGWHYRHEKPILEDFLAHLDHPYKTVREAIGRVIATIYKTRYHESYENVGTLLDRQKAASSIGSLPYQPSEEFGATIREVFGRLAKWRAERAPGQQTPSSYTSGSKTVLLWLDCTLTSYECVQLVPFFHETFIEELLHMMDVKEDPELQRLAYHVYRHLPNIPLRDGEDGAFVQALIRIGRDSTSWHQRLRVLINIQVVYFRRIFLTAREQRDELFNAVSDMLGDAQLEVRSAASATLAGMIRCSPRAVREAVVVELKERFETQLRLNPMPARRRTGANSGTETPVDVQRQILRRHAAVLGLGALIEAFPYATPPPRWMPEVLSTLATRAAGDSGVVGKAAKQMLSEFKKTRQDSWAADQKYFTSEQLEDLEGVLWKSYFA